MNLEISATHQAEMRSAYGYGAPGILISGCVWIFSALATGYVGISEGVWALLIGGALIYPLGLVLAKLIGLRATTEKDNGLNQLALASTVWLLMGCFMSYGLYVFQANLFFPAMLATIGGRYLIFASVYGYGLYWWLGAVLIVAANLTLFTSAAPVIAVALGGLIEMVFGVIAFNTYRKAM